MSRSSFQAFACAFLGAVVGAATVKSLDRPAAAAGDDEPRVIYARRIVVVGENDRAGITTIDPGSVSLSSTADLVETRITRGRITLQAEKPDREIYLDAGWKGGGGLVLRHAGHSRASLSLSPKGQGTVRFEDDRADVLADFGESQDGPELVLYGAGARPVFKVPR